MLEIIATWWFWISVLLFVGLIISEATETLWASTVSIVIAVLLYQFLADVNIFGYIKDNPGSAAQYVALYFGTGVVWGTVKWWLFALNAREKYREIRDAFLKSHNLNDNIIPALLKKDWDNECSMATAYNSRGLYEDFPPKASKNKVRITRWMTYWPTSMLWTLLDDFLGRVWNAIYNFIASTLQAISNKVFENETVKFE